MGKKGCKNMPMNAEDLGILKSNYHNNFVVCFIPLSFSDRIPSRALSWQKNLQ